MRSGKNMRSNILTREGGPFRSLLSLARGLLVIFPCYPGMPDTRLCELPDKKNECAISIYRTILPNGTFLCYNPDPFRERKVSKMMNTKSPSNGVNELNVFSQKTRNLFLPPPLFYLKYVGIARYGRESKMSSFLPALKCALVCFATVFFVFAGIAHAQQTVDCNHSPSDPPTDKDALIALYCDTGGDNWTNKDGWLTDMPLNMWHGVSVANPGDPATRVTRLTLNDNNLTGPIPAELGNLTALEWLLLNGNELTAIPPELGDLGSLQYLYLQDNRLTGTIPPQLGNLSRLLRLYLQDNQLTGTIPPQLGNLTALTHLELHNNELTGAIPSGLGDLAALRRLRLSNNKLTGAIPSALGKLTSLTVLHLHNNQLTGGIPDLSDLTSLQSLQLENNQLTGAIPSGLGDLAALRRLRLSNNKLTGAIPSELGKLTALEWLLLNGNNLTAIPPELGDLGSLQYLYLQDNRLTGTIPPQLGSLSRLLRLYLQDNQLTGTIPPQLGNLGSLQQLVLNGNNLTGPIPAELGNLTALTHLWLQDNDLEGPVPTQIESLFDNSLSRLLLWGNQLSLETLSDKLVKMVEKSALSLFYAFSGGDDWTNKDGWNSSSTVSDWHGVETDSDGRVTELNLADNNLTGEISDSLRGLARLRLLELSKNKLSGAIPPRLGNLTSLEQLHLDRNQLSGEIPPELGNLTGLQVLDLSDNQLSCDIPDLSPLSQLSQLWLQNNYQLGGTLSESLADSLQLLNISCTSIPPGDLPDRIPDFVVDPAPEDCMGTVEAACPSPAVSPGGDTGGDPGGDTGGDPGGDTGGDPGGDTGGDPGGDTGGDPGGDEGGDSGGDERPPTESPGGDEGGGCAIAPNAGAGETSQGIAFDLILVMSALLVISWRNHSAAKKT